MRHEVDKTQMYLVILLLGYIAWLIRDWQRKRVVEVDIVSSNTGHGSEQVSEASHSHADLKVVNREKIG